MRLIQLFILSAFMFASFSVNAQKHKFLEGKKYTVKYYEIKPTGRGKAIDGEVYIKNGKLYADIMEEKIVYPPSNYNVTLDSTYTEDEEEIQLINGEIMYSEDKSDYKVQFTVTNYDISGTFILSKNGVEKKKYEFDGSEKKKK